MGLDDMIISAFCIIDDALTSIGGRIRRAGPTPTVSDAEVITMEVIGEFLGLDHDNHLMEFFRGQYGHFFPGIRRIHRTTFVRQAANLWRVKEQVWRRVLESGRPGWSPTQAPHRSGLAQLGHPALQVAGFAARR